MTAWAARIERRAIGALGAMRRRGDVLVREESDHLWLRGPATDETLDLLVRCLPGAARYAVLDDGQLVPHGRRIPRGRLPQGEWIVLSDWLEVELPPAALPGAVPAPIALVTARSEIVAEANVLLTTLDDWLKFAQAAAEVRLAPLTFAADARRRVIVRGTPLPAIRGARYVELGGIAVEGGWTWSPAVDAEVLRAAMRLGEGDLALLHRDATWELAPAEYFVSATRSAVRLTAEGSVHA